MSRNPHLKHLAYRSSVRRHDFGMSRSKLLQYILPALLRPVWPTLLGVALVASNADKLRAQETLSPIEVINVKTLLGRADVSIVDQTHIREFWAALVRVNRSDEAIVLTGSSSGHQVFRLPDNNIERIGLDYDGNVYVKGTERVNKGSSSVGNDPARIYRIDRSSLLLLRKGAAPWTAVNEDSLRQLDAGSRDRLVLHHRPNAPAQHEFVLALTDGNYAVLGSRTEEISVYDSLGKLLSYVRADLNDAYSRLGRPTTRHQITEGRSRIIWASSGPDNRVYLGLAEFPAAGPAMVAVLDPKTGKVLRLLAAELPRVLNKQSEFNPEGIILPSAGSVSEKLLIVDSDECIIAVYTY